MSQPPKIVVLTGAGISAESGLATFRAANGLWENERVEDVATYEGYLRNPQKVQQFYNQLRRKLQSPAIKPNAAHLALSKLQQHFGGENVTIVTQNVDNLHERAQSQNIIHMHGELLKARHESTGEVIDCFTDIDHQATPDLRPHIVWFGEVPLQMDLIEERLEQANYFIAIGTSGNVYPAAGFVQVANRVGAMTIELNLQPSLTESHFQQQIYGPATQIVPAFVEQLLTAYP